MINTDGSSDETLNWTPSDHVDYYTGQDVINLLDAINKLHADTLGVHEDTITKIEKIATDAIDEIKKEAQSDKNAWTDYDLDKA